MLMLVFILVPRSLGDCSGDGVLLAVELGEGEEEELREGDCGKLKRG
jgi:hypothetical protein